MLGCYFEWFDDLQVLYLLNGEVINDPFNFFYFTVHNFNSNIFALLYKIDGVNWYGISMYLLLFASILNINYILYHVINPQKLKGFLLFFYLSIVLFLAFLVENTYLINFTRTGLLLYFSSFIIIALLIKSKRKFRNKTFIFAYFGILFFIGFNIRPPVSLLFLPICGIFLFTLFTFKKAVRFNLFMIAGVLIYASFSWITLGKAHKKDVKQVFKTEKYIVNVLDGANADIDIDISSQDSIKIAALKAWYFADQDTLLNQDFLQKIGKSHPFRKNVINNWQTNFKEELEKAKSNYTEKYLPQLNWYNKTVSLLIILVLLPLLFFISQAISLKTMGKLYLFFILCVAYIFFVTILNKMEDRVLAPFLIFLFLALIVHVKHSEVKSKEILFLPLIVILGIIGGSRYFNYQAISKQRKADLKMKEEIRSEIKRNFSNKYVYFDFFTLNILETSPFKDVNFPDNWITGIEIWNRYSENVTSINETIGCQDWPCFYIEASKRKNDFVFFFKSDRVQITKDYYKLVYGIDLRFKKVSRNLLINDFHYSFY